MCHELPFWRGSVGEGSVFSIADEIGGAHGRYVTFQIAEVAEPRELFGEIVRLIDNLQPTPAPA